MADFVVLWDLVQGVHLTSEDDKITWKWTANGVYTAKSVYEAQFREGHTALSSLLYFGEHMRRASTNSLAGC